MAENSGIEWTHLPGYKSATWNPLAGCTPISPGCTNCYAASMARRLEAMGQVKYAGTAERRGSVDVFTGRINFDEAALSIPLKGSKPTCYFVNSMSDLFHEAVPEEFIDKVFAVMALTPCHVFQVLTKRPERAAAYLEMVDDERDMQRWQNEAEALVGGNFAADWPLRNVWLGTSVEDQKRADERIPHLLRCPAAVRFLSCEPLLEQVVLWKWLTPKICGCRGNTDCKCYPGKSLIDWIIAGGESGSHARPMYPDWPRGLRDQCKAAGVPFFFKQWGEWGPHKPDNYWRETKHRYSHDSFCWGRNGLQYKSTEPDQWLGSTTVYRVGKKAAGRLLDGREWSEFPTSHLDAAAPTKP